MGGCTNCGGKIVCDDRKGTMFTAIEETLDRIYPSRRWGEMEDRARLGAGLPPGQLEPLRAEIAQALSTAALVVPGEEDEYCDYIYALCVGRRPCIAEVRAGQTAPPEEWDGAPIEELYLRLSLSDLGPLATVQQVTLRAERTGDEVVVEELPRAGVFEPMLLPRLQRLVALLPHHGLTSVDFGDLTNPPPGFDPGPYDELYGGTPDAASYLFYPQPSTTRKVVLLSAHES